MKLRKALLKTGVIGILFVVLSSFSSFAENEDLSYVYGYGLDTVAGSDTFLRSSQIAPNMSVTFEVSNPYGEVVKLSTISSQNGIAQTKFSGDYTKVAGVYTLSVGQNQSSFTVYAADVSKTSSTMVPASQVVHIGTDSAILAVRLIDDYGNAVSGHLVKLISSSNSDQIEVVSTDKLTSNNGEISFKVYSPVSGVSTYSAYDITADKILDSKAKIVYFDSTDYIFSNNVPTDYLYASEGNGSIVDTLKFEDLPQTIKAGDSVTFSLTAYDDKNQKVTNYIGSVRFSVLGDNAFYADLPEDYTFTQQDIGKHTFSLALTFKQPGTYRVEARDLNNVSLSGEQFFTVLSSLGNLPANKTIILSNPVPGTYSNKIQVISGMATPSARLKIFDNDIEITSLVADAAGKFSFTTSVLSDGVHEMYVASVNEIGTIIESSSTVEITIDASAPEVSQIAIEPGSTVDPGTIVKVKLFTADDLSKATILFKDNLYEMTKNPAGYYEGSFPAPIEFGQYPVNFSLVDQIGNESRVENKASLNVGGVLGQTGSVVIGDVTGLVAVGSDHRVTLNWVAPKIVVNKIKNYRVYYGLSPNKLTEAVDTLTDSTIWFIPNLQVGQEYYFAVVAVDDKGNISTHFSNIVSSTAGPFVNDVISPDVANGSAGGAAISEMEEDASKSGPEIFWLIWLSIIGGVFYVWTSKKRFV